LIRHPLSSLGVPLVIITKAVLEKNEIYQKVFVE
jgi:hypothetical protein